MYVDYYKLKEEPFQITPDPKFAWLGEKHAEAFSALIYGIQNDKGFLVLTGDVGTGKTLMINCLLNSIDSNVIVARVPNPRMAPVDFLNFLSAKFKWEKNFNTKGKFLLHLENFLYQVHSEHKKVLLIIDEAQQLSNHFLEEIRLLSNIELEYKKLINIFIVGQIELDDKLSEEKNKALRERIAIWYHIDPLSEIETGHYISYRLGIAGCENEIFKSDAIREIYFISKGIPRQINILCDHALLAGFAFNIKKINGNVIRECAEDLRMLSYGGINANPLQEIDGKKALQTVIKTPKKQWPTSQIFAALSMILLIIIGFLIYNLKPWVREDITAQSLQTNKENKDFASVKQALGSEGLKTQIHAGNYDLEKPHSELKGETLLDVPPDTKKDSQVDIKNESYLPKMNFVVYFKHNSNELHDKAVAKLDRIVEFMRNNPETKIEVKGYTDSSGLLDYNLYISDLRANIVKTYLASNGIHNSRIEAKGLGPENPIASNETPEGRRLNRRVEIEFYSNNAYDSYSNISSPSQ
jgi:general secretion pathway protein A